MMALALTFSIVGILISIISFVMALRARARYRKAEAALPKLRACSCKHGFGFHKDDGGGCNAWEGMLRCACVRFDGEVPADLWGRLI